MTARDPMPPGTVVTYADSPHTYTVFVAHVKPGWRWIHRDGGAPFAAKLSSLTVVAPPALPVPVSPARATDPATSHAAAKAMKVKAGSQQFRMLAAYEHDRALSDYEAAVLCGLAPGRACFWKRASELREGGLIEAVGTTIDGLTRAEVTTCQITEKGREALNRA